MSIVSVFSASYCHGREVAQDAAKRLGYGLLSDDDLLNEAAKRFGVKSDKLRRAMYGPRSVFDKVTHEKERNISYLRATLAGLIRQDDVVYHGFAGHLAPRDLPHLLRVCLAARFDYRVGLASQTTGISSRQAEKKLNRQDDEQKRWTLHLYGLGPWDDSLYDMLIPMDSTSVEDTVLMICETSEKAPVKTTPAAEKAMEDFLLSSEVYLALGDKSHGIEVSASDGDVTLSINRYVTRVEHLKDELKKTALAVPGVKNATSKLGPHYSRPNIYPKLDLDLPPKILLVDDEKEFVLTLSERLQTRNLESAIAYDGEQALSIMETDAPDVMVLDLRMPGIDGLEVLRRVKQDNAATEVIILTGHGSNEEMTLAEELGAFAYLRKPVNIDVLADTMQRAYARFRRNQGNGGED